MAKRDESQQSVADERVLCSSDPEYPASLRQIFDPPSRLHVRGFLAGRACAIAVPAIAVVGARDATAYGLSIAHELGRALAEQGVLVVSGLALGIDGAAHRGALEAGGRTVAVVGAGTDIEYPRQHRTLRREILASGAIVGELPPGTVPHAHHFPRRNRLISGLSLGVVVVEASLRSGSLITAAHALEQGREVFAVPGPIGSPRSRGPNALLKRGAKLVETVDDILAELPPGLLHTPGLAGVGPRSCSSGERIGRAGGELLEQISNGHATVDEMAASMGRKVSEIWEVLLDLEVRGRVLRGPGGRFVCAREAVADEKASPTSRVDSRNR